MIHSFEGEHYQKVDRKGRMSVPADFRRELALGDADAEVRGTVRMKIVYGQHLKEHVAVYPMDEYQRIVEDIYAMPRSKARDQKRLSQLFVTKSLTIEADKDGRVILNKTIRDKLGIEEGEIYFRGGVGNFEMWNAEHFRETVEADIDEWLDEQDEDFDPLELLGGE
ncbi:cell division/cell wall cluster transcriptional repressor MraZ [Marivivens donghaensis]|uniref:Transcriptional regulator MraZ n=1 Tax=Marivivens donghaensis TaxID=1699413 RepID=A0ABX0W240_9RHOB|nr:cell division/cell wall cluster transcriptional repressor MraZ [Marivivens aquimaris]NIY72987.1 cell division/cell wall cluster transcriptional repressor MraZ [Marivivens donghaensis]